MGKPEWSEPNRRIKRIYDLSCTSVSHRISRISTIRVIVGLSPGSPYSPASAFGWLGRGERLAEVIQGHCGTSSSQRLGAEICRFVFRKSLVYAVIVEAYDLAATPVTWICCDETKAPRGQ